MGGESKSSVAEILGTLIRDGGPLFGPMLFVFAIALSWGYNSLLRQVAIRQNRMSLLLVEKGVVTLRELRDYGILVDVGGVFGVMEGLV